MPYDLTEPLVIGISSRALFNLEEENRIYENEGLAAYEEYQVKHESDILQKGSAFQLVKAFLQLNKLQEKRLVEVIVMSRNSPNTSLRIFNSIQDYELDITRAALTGGSEIAPYLRAFKTDLFLSAFEPDVKQAIDSDVAAGKILTGTSLNETRFSNIFIEKRVSSRLESLERSGLFLFAAFLYLLQNSQNSKLIFLCKVVI